MFGGHAAAVRAGAKLGEPFATLAIPAPLAAANPGLRTRVTQQVDAVDPRTLVAELEAIARLEDLRPRLGRLRVPTLVRVGDQDLNTLETFARESATAHPLAQTRAISSARLETAARAKIAETCASTVFSVQESARPISRFVAPVATSVSTSR